MSSRAAPASAKETPALCGNELRSNSCFRDFIRTRIIKLDYRVAQTRKFTDIFYVSKFAQTWATLYLVNILGSFSQRANSK